MASSGEESDVRELERQLLLGTAATAADAVRHDVGHEIANLLHALRFSAVLTQEHVAATASSLDDHERAAADVDAARQCMTDLLAALAQLDAVVERLRWRATAKDAPVAHCDVAHTVDLAVRTLRPLLERVARLTLVVDAPATAAIDRFLLSELVVHLVTSASQGIAAGAPDDHGITIRVGVDGNAAVVSVSGPSNAAGARGSSVGLVIVRDIATGARGKLVVEDDARWSVRLPLVTAQA